MAMTPSQLSIIVKSQGVEKAAQDLDKLAKAAASVDSETKAFVIAQSKLAESNQKVGKSSEAAARNISVQELAMVKAHEAALAMNAVISKAAKSQEELTNAMGKASRGVSAKELAMIKAHEQALKMNAAFDKQAAALKNVSHHGNIFNNTLRSMATAAIAYIGINFAAGIIKEADSWSMMQSKLKLAVGGMELAKSVQNDLYEMSQRLRVPLEDSAKLFTRMAVPLQKLGQTVGDTKKIVESFSMALKLGGATGQEASSAMLQLSQSFNAGRLNGGEFNSVAEAAPSVLRALEVELIRVGKGADLARYGLKELAAKGVLTTSIMAEALKRAAPKWESEFKQLPLTVDGAMTRIKNAWQKAIGEMGQDTKFNEKMAKSLKTIEDMLPSVAKSIATALTFIVDHGEQVIKTFATIAGLMTLAKLGAGISAMYAAGKAAMALSGGLAAVRAAMLAIGVTPLGLALTALGVVIGASITLLGRKKDAWEGAKEASDKVKNNADLIKSMQLETLAMMEQVDVARAKASLPSLYTKEIEEAKKAKQSTDALTTAKTTAAKVEQDILNWKKNQKGSIGTKIGEGEYYMPKELKDARDNAKKLVEQEEVKNKMIVTQTKLGAQQKEAVVKQEMDALAIKYALEAKTGKQRADAVKEAAIAELEVLKSQGLGKQAALDRMIIIEREYEASLDKIKTPKAEKEVAKKIKEEAEANEKLKQELIAVNAQKSLTLLLGKDAGKLLPAEKELIKMESEKASARNLSVQRQIVASALETKAIEDKFAAQNKAEDLAKKSAKAAQEELQTVEDQIAAFGKVKGSIQDSEIARLNEQLTIAKGVVGNEALVKSLEKEIATREKLKGKSGELAGLKDGAKEVEEAKKFLDDLYDTTKIDKFADASSKGLKGIIKGFAELSKVMDKSAVRQASIAKERAAIDKTYTKDSVEWSAARTRADEREAGYKIAGWAETADAAKNFFQEGTRGYQAMDAVSKVMHAAQMVRSLQAAASGVMAGAAQMFGQSGWGGFAGVAAMGAVMAGLGYSAGVFGSSGGGGVKAADVQKTQGTGSVFGDTSAKSDSVKASLDLLKTSFDRLYPVNQGMLKALKNIESSMTGLTNLVVRSGGIVEGSNFGVQEGVISQGNWKKGFVAGSGAGAAIGSVVPIIGSAIGGLIGGALGAINSLMTKTTQNVVDSGLQFGGSLQGMQQGKGFNQYASVDTTTSKYFGLSKKTSNSVQTQGLSEELNSQFAMIFTNMQKSLEEAGKVLYGSSKGVTQALENMVFEVSKVSLKGLTGQALTDAINGVISKALDQMAGTAFTNLEQFRQVGEGYAQTVIRVANSFSLVNATFDKLGMKLYAMDDAGIKAAMSFTELFDSMEEMQSVASDYYDKFYTEQEKQEKIVDALKKQFTAMNEVLPDSIKAYRELVDNTTDPAKIATLWKLSGAFSEVFGTMESAAKDIPQKMKDAFESLSNDAQRWLSIRNQAAALKDEINVAMGNPKKDPAIRMQQLWDAMSKDVTPEQKLQLAGELKDLMLQKYQVEKDSLTRLIDFGKQLRGYVDSLKVGSLSPLTTGQKLSEAQAQYQATFAKAQGGDVAAQGMLQGKADAYLQLAQTALASSGQYSAIFSEVTNGLDSLGIESMSAAEQANQTAAEQLAELQRLSDFVGSVEVTANSYYNSSLTALASQITLMDAMYQKMGIFDGMVSSIAGLPAEIAAALSGRVGNSLGNDEFIRNLYQSVEGRVGSQIDNAGYNYWMKDLMTQSKEQVASNFVIASQENNVNRNGSNTSALETQVAALTAEVKGLREDQNLQTGAMINANALISETSTAAIVTATKESVKDESWQNSLKPELV